MKKVKVERTQAGSYILSIYDGDRRIKSRSIPPGYEVQTSREGGIRVRSLGQENRPWSAASYYTPNMLLEGSGDITLPSRAPMPQYRREESENQRVFQQSQRKPSGGKGAKGIADLFGGLFGGGGGSFPATEDVPIEDLFGDLFGDMFGGGGAVGPTAEELRNIAAQALLAETQASLLPQEFEFEKTREQTRAEEETRRLEQQKREALAATISELLGTRITDIGGRR